MTDFTVTPDASAAPELPAGVRAQINLVDVMNGDDPTGGLSVEMVSTNISVLNSPSNLMCAFLAKYWEILCTSAAAEFTQGMAELSNKPVEPTSLKLVSADGSALVPANGSGLVPGA